MNNLQMDAPLIDWNQFDSVIPHAKSPCVEIFHRFCDSFAQEIASVRAAYAAEDKEFARSKLHQLRGAGSSFGLAAFARRSQLLEERFQKGFEISPQEFEDSVAELTLVLQRSRQAAMEERAIGRCPNDHVVQD